MFDDFEFNDFQEDEFDYDDDIELEIDEDWISGSNIKERLDSETIKILQKF